MSPSGPSGPLVKLSFASAKFHENIMIPSQKFLNLLCLLSVPILLSVTDNCPS